MRVKVKQTCVISMFEVTQISQIIIWILELHMVMPYSFNSLQWRHTQTQSVHLIIAWVTPLCWHVYQSQILVGVTGCLSLQVLSFVCNLWPNRGIVQMFVIPFWALSNFFMEKLWTQFLQILELRNNPMIWNFNMIDGMVQELLHPNDGRGRPCKHAVLLLTP